MKARDCKMGVGGWITLSVLECGDLSLSSRRGLYWHRSTVTMVRPVKGADELAQSKRFVTVVALLLGGVLWPMCIQAQSYSIGWSTMDGGGGTSTGGVHTVSGTIGQPDAGPTMTNGQYAVTGGFWALPQAVQTPGAPLLSITAASPGFATISWTPDAPGFVLQETVSLSPTNWVNSPSGSTNPVVVPAPATVPTKFYRLNKP